jgi:excisionase family DNA binding protein
MTMKQNNENLEHPILIEALQIISDNFEKLEHKLLERIVNPHDVLNSKQAAKYLGIKLSWLDKLCCLNKITYYKTGKLRYFKISELDKYRLKNIVKSVDDSEQEEHNLSFSKKINHSIRRKY